MDQLAEAKARAGEAGGLLLDLQDMAYATDGGIGTEASLGLLVLETDQTIEDEFRFLLPAARAALGALGARRIALLTPYARRINESLRAALQARGMQIPVMGSFNQEDDNVVARISPASLAEAIIRLGRSETCEAVFVSCTSLRLARIVEEVEAQLGKPVTSSNHALA